MLALSSYALFVLPFAAASQSADLLTPARIANMKLVTAVDIAPDASLVAFTLSVPRKPGDEPTGPAWDELRVVDRAGKERAFITGEVNVSAVRFSKDGRSITYLSKRNGEKNTSLYRIPVDGGESRRVLTADTGITSYSFSPDESKVAFLAQEPENEKLKKAKEKGFDAEVYEEQLRFTRAFVADLGASAGKPRMLPLEGNASELSWSPAGDKLALALAPTPLVDDEYMARRIRVVDVQSGAVVGKIENPGKLGAVRFSPDGKYLAYISAATKNDTHEGRLFAVPVAGGAPAELLPDLDGHVSAIAWRDADTVACVIDSHVTSSIEEVDVDGKNRHPIIAGGEHVLAGLALAADGTVATTDENWRHPREVLVCAESKGTPTQLTDHNEWIRDLRLAKQEVAKYKARDGLDLEGILVRPLDEVSGQRYPLILCVHGGPESHVKNGFVTTYSNPGQLAAAHGMAVFYPNYRGSTGRGVKFAALGQKDDAGAEFDDLVDAADYFVQQGLADTAKIGITGGSYGGYATAWCATKYSERFAAGVMFVGISDLISKSGTSDIPNENFDVHARMWPWNDWNFHLERSPVRWVENCKTPLLICGGKDDPRVNPAQSLELYRQLKILGKTPVRLVQYPGEGHGNRKSASRYDFCLRMLQWFDHYLKGPGGNPPAAELDYGAGN